MTVDEFIDTWPPHIAGLAEALRRFIMQHAPGALEELHVGWRVILYSRSHSREMKFCAIAPHTKGVNLQFHQGASLTSPLLEGAGRSMRHVRIKAESDLVEALGTLIREAGQAGPPGQ